MTQNKTSTRQSGQDDAELYDDPQGENAMTLLEQASGYSTVAEAALEDCDRGEDATVELERRRNRSGQ